MDTFPFGEVWFTASCCLALPVWTLVAQAVPTRTDQLFVLDIGTVAPIVNAIDKLVQNQLLTAVQDLVCLYGRASQQLGSERECQQLTQISSHSREMKLVATPERHDSRRTLAATSAHVHS